MVTFISDYKGTCALCWDSVHPGDTLVEKRMEECGCKFTRNVHAECHLQLVESIKGDDALWEYETSTVDYK